MLSIKLSIPSHPFSLHLFSVHLSINQSVVFLFPSHIYILEHYLIPQSILSHLLCLIWNLLEISTNQCMPLSCYSFNQAVNDLPPSLLSLYFGYFFDQPVDHLPQSINHLTLAIFSLKKLTIFHHRSPTFRLALYLIKNLIIFHPILLNYLWDQILMISF